MIFLSPLTAAEPQAPKPSSGTGLLSLITTGSLLGWFGIQAELLAFGLMFAAYQDTFVSLVNFFSTQPRCFTFSKHFETFGLWLRLFGVFGKSPCAVGGRGQCWVLLPKLDNLRICCAWSFLPSVKKSCQPIRMKCLSNLFSRILGPPNTK